MTFVGWYSVATGIAIAGLWTVLLVGRAVPEIAAGDVESWFHITAESITAALLIIGETAVLTVEDSQASILAACALGRCCTRRSSAPATTRRGESGGSWRHSHC